MSLLPRRDAEDAGYGRDGYDYGGYRASGGMAPLHVAPSTGLLSRVGTPSQINSIIVHFQLLVNSNLSGRT